MPDNEIVTELSREFLEEFRDEVLGTVPAEKVQADLRQAQIGRVLLKEGAVAAGNLGQKLGEIDARTYFRWLQDRPSCWEDKGFVNE